MIRIYTILKLLKAGSCSLSMIIDLGKLSPPRCFTEQLRVSVEFHSIDLISFCQ